MPLLSCVERRNLYALLTEDRPANGRGRPAPRAHGARLAASAHLIRSPRKLLRASSLGCSGGGLGVRRALAGYGNHVDRQGLQRGVQVAT
jgi:hypothetical protein